MKVINKYGSLLIVAIMAISMIFTACESENITTETYSFPDVYVAVIKVSPTVLIPGDIITIEGADLNHVKAVRFWNEEEENLDVAKVDFIESSAVKIIAEIPLNVPLLQKVAVVTDDNQIITWLLPITDRLPEITDDIPSTIIVGNKITITGTDFDLLTGVMFGNITVNVEPTETNEETSIEVTVPALALGDSIEFKTVSKFRGAQLVTKLYVFDKGLEPVADPSLIIFDFENGVIDGGRWDGVGQESTEGGLTGAFYEITEDTWIANKYWWVAENWMTHPSVSGKTNYNVKMDVRLFEDVKAPIEKRSEIRLMLGGEVVNILPYLLDEAGIKEEKDGLWTTGGGWVTITIPLTEWSDLADPTPAKGGDWGIAVWINESDFIGFGIDNIRYEPK